MTTDEKVNTLCTILLGVDNDPGVLGQLKEFFKSWDFYQNKGRFESCPFLQRKPGQRWLYGMLVTVGVALASIGTNIVLKILHF